MRRGRWAGKHAEKVQGTGPGQFEINNQGEKLMSKNEGTNAPLPRITPGAGTGKSQPEPGRDSAKDAGVGDSRCGWEVRRRGHKTIVNPRPFEPQLGRKRDQSMKKVSWAGRNESYNRCHPDVIPRGRERTTNVEGKTLLKLGQYDITSIGKMFKYGKGKKKRQ